MDIQEIKTIVKEIQRLKNIKGEPYKKVKERKLKNMLLEMLPSRETVIDNFVLYKTETYVPYLQIYTWKSWEKSQNYIKNKLS